MAPSVVQTSIIESEVPALWQDGHVSVFHPREPCVGLPPVFVQSTYQILKGGGGTPERDIYASAKLHFTMAAAEEVVQRCISESVLDAIIARTINGGGLDARIVIPHPAFDDLNGIDQVSATVIPKNALPFAYAAYLARIIGLQIDEEIIQIARVGRTKLSRWKRFLYQPSFGGIVRPGQAYVVVDDVVTTGGTLAVLHSYIVRNGGRVVFASALANIAGKHQELGILDQTVNALMASFGEGLNEFWTATIGHGIHCLTEAEGKTLREWSDEQQAKGFRAGPELLQRLRGQLDEAAAKDG